MNKSKLFSSKNPIFEMNKSTLSRNIFTPYFHTTFQITFSHKIFKQNFHTKFSHNIFAQYFCITFLHNIFTQHFHTTFSHNIFTQNFCTTFSHYIFTQNFCTKMNKSKLFSSKNPIFEINKKSNF